MTPANDKSIGIAYGVITVALVATVAASGWCWGSQSGPEGVQDIHDACLNIWALAGVLLAVSQIVFVIIALRMKDHNIKAGSEARASVSKVLILVSSAVILLAIAFFVWTLLNMPS